MTPEERIDRINELAKKAKTSEGLTDEETQERRKLREEYLAIFRGNMKNELNRIVIVDEEGHDITPEAARKLQREGGMREAESEKKQ